MNKFAKILSVVLSAVLALSVSIVMLVSAFAAATPVLSLNILEDGKDVVVVEVRLDKGEFNAIDLQVKAASNKIGDCISAYETDAFMDYIKDIKREGGQGSSACFAQTGKLSAALTIAYGEEDGSVIKYTFGKNSADKVTNEDLSLVVTSCKNSDGEVVAQTVNNLPDAVAEVTTEEQTTVETTKPEETTTEATEPEEETTEATTTEAATEATEPEEETTEAATEATEPEEETTEATTEATTTEAATEPEEENTEATDTTEVTETSSAPAEEKDDVQSSENETPAVVPGDSDAESTSENSNVTTNDSTVITSDGDSVNPNTGDAFTTTAAFASLLAISAAVVVGLRKKED